MSQRFGSTTTASTAGSASTRPSSSAELTIPPTASWRCIGCSTEAVDRHRWAGPLELVEGIEWRVDLVVDERRLAIAAIRTEVADHRSLARQRGVERLSPRLADRVDCTDLGRERADHHVLHASRSILRWGQVEEGRLVRDKYLLSAVRGDW